MTTGKASLSGRIAELMARRRAPTPPAAAAPRRRRVSAAAAEVAPPIPMGEGREPVWLPDGTESKVISDILAQARYEPRPARGGDYLHVSDLLGKCIRKFAIIEQNELQRLPQRLSLMDLLTFGVGDTIHDIIKSRVAHSAAASIWGNWSCKCGVTHSEAPCTLAAMREADGGEACPHCNTIADTYCEVPMRDKELMIVGTPDLVMLISDLQAFFISELKSISHKAFEELVRPQPDHILQVMFYWYLMKKLGYPVTSQVSVVYVTKGYMFVGSPYKEFTIDAESQQLRLTPYLDDARALLASRENGELPPRTMCASDNAPEAKKCEVCSICFGNSNAAPTKVSFAEALGRSPAIPARPIKVTRRSR